MAKLAEGTDKVIGTSADQIGSVGNKEENFQGVFTDLVLAQ